MLIAFAVLAVIGPFVGFVGGFSFGQRSVRVVATQTERMVLSDRMTVERTVPVEEAKPVPVTRETADDEYSAAIPPMYQDLVKTYQGGKK
jgi:hypothetical protein